MITKDQLNIIATAFCALIWAILGIGFLIAAAVAPKGSIIEFLTIPGFLLAVSAGILSAGVEKRTGAKDATEAECATKAIARQSAS